MDEYNFGKKRKIGGDGNLADRISELPDEVLVSVLSLLPLKQAASTSILSRRWRYVWTSTMTLNFDTINFEAIDALNLKRKVKEVQNPTYVGWVNRVLKQYRGQNIERFRVCYTLDDRFKSSIDKWIQFAMQKNVQILELDFAKEGSRFSDGYYTFPHELLGINFDKGSGVEQPAGKGVEKFDYSAWGLSTVEQFMDSAWENLMRFRIPSDDLHLCGYSTGFIKSLKVLNFGQVQMRDEVVEYLLTNCPVLEQLSLIAAKNLVNLRVVGRSSPLKHLVIKHCQDLKNIEIRDANIVSFAYFAANVVDLLLHKVPLLVELSITTRVWSKYFKPSITQLSCCLSQLEILKLDIKPRLYTENYVFPMSPKLKHLELIVFADDQKSFHYLSSFLRASPYLQTLVLKFYRRQISWEVGDIERAAKCPHHSLKLVEIAGYRARTFDVEHVMYLIKNAVVLEKLVIDPVQSWRWPTGMDRSTYEVQEERKARYHAEQHLKEKVPSAIEFVCL